jgi:amphi-Trp domain-containing protein
MMQRTQPQRRESLVDVFEVKQKETVSREEVAERLRLLADMLARHNDLEFDRGGMHFTVHVPDELQLKVELEVETDERELEIELKW